MYKDVKIDHLPVILSPQEIISFNFSPDIVWIFDLDRHGFWWGNTNALEFWGLDNVQQLINKDLSADTEGARKRIEQTFVKAVHEKVTKAPWTIYPHGRPKAMLTQHIAVLLGNEKHRGIIAFISEQQDKSSQPENILFAEAVRYTSVAVSCFSLEGEKLFENPAFTELYDNDDTDATNGTCSDFVRLFVNKEEGAARLAYAKQLEEGEQLHLMQTNQGIKRHNVDIRVSRHSLSGDYVLLVSEYDVTELHTTIAELEKTKEELKKIAHYDTLTGLPTVWLCRERLKAAILKAKRDKCLVAVMFVDLDGFKQVNDKYGHSIGDELLAYVAMRLSSTFRESDTVARIGGDEFLVCLPEQTDRKNAMKLAQKAIHDVSQDYRVNDDVGQSHCLKVTASIGLVFYPTAGESVEQLIAEADQKMYQAKQQGKNRFAC